MPFENIKTLICVMLARCVFNTYKILQHDNSGAALVNLVNCGQTGWIYFLHACPKADELGRVWACKCVVSCFACAENWLLMLNMDDAGLKQQLEEMKTVHMDISEKEMLVCGASDVKVQVEGKLFEISQWMMIDANLHISVTGTCQGNSIQFSF